MTRHPAGTELWRIFPGDSQLACRMRDFDWAGTDLGPPEEWGSHLRTAVSLCLTSRIPIVIFWGEHFRTLYNDPYISFLGDTKHPLSLGQPARDCWREIWDTIGPMLEGVRASGQATWSEDLLMFFARHLPLEEVYIRFTYGPLLADDGQTVDGIFCPCTETTERVIGERRVETLRRLSVEPAETRSVETACRESAAALAQNPRDIPFAAIYLVDDHGKAARLIASTGLPEGTSQLPLLVSLVEGAPTPCPFSSVARTRRGEEILTPLSAPFPGGPYPEPASRVLVLPIATGVHERLVGFLVVGVSPRRTLDDAYRTFFDLVAGHIGTAVGNARAYEAERKRTEALVELDRAKTRFFANVSHEFRTPLTLMMGPLQDLLARGESCPPDDRALVALVHRNALRLLKLVNALLAFSRIEAGRAEACYQPTDLAVLTIELASSFRSAIERAGLSFRVDCPSLSHQVYVDRDMWEQMVLNLLSNALKFTFEGEIELTLRPRPDGSAVELAVRDTGIGITREELPRLFERFHRVQGARARTHEGTGIGLALVNELVKVHGGTITVESEVGHGTALTIGLPFGAAHLLADRVNAEPSPPSAARHEAFVEEALLWMSNDETTSGRYRASLTSSRVDMGSAQSPRRGKVLLADDNADMRAYVQRLLCEQGYDVACATNGRQALELAVADPPDVVLTDVMMPELEGFGLLKELRSRDETRLIPVIMLSARAGEEARIEGLEGGADDYLIKPFAARELLARVGAHLSLSRMRKEVADSLRHVTEAANRKLAELSHELMEVHERERAWIARELHDDIGQRILGLTMRLHGLMKASAGGFEQVRAGVADVCRQFSALGSDIQAMSRRLHSSKLDLLGLTSAANSLCQELAATHAMTIELSEDGVPNRIPQGVAVGLFRVLQEALSNGIKHAGVKHLSVTLRGTCDGIQLDVADRGAGFDPELAIRGPGLGLLSMRERLSLLGGELSVESQPGAGARIRARVPLRPYAHTP